MGKHDRKPIPMAERYPRTISIELFDAWQALRRKGDPARMAQYLDMSRFTIDKALNYGYVSNRKYEIRISKYFNNRLSKEQEKGKKMFKSASI